jgi:hypothetical protein
MSKRPIFAILLGLSVMLPALARADDKQDAKNDKPGVFLRFAALDQLRGDFRYLGEVVGEGERAKQLDELIKSKLGEKGLEGIDPKKPLGAYGWVGAFGIDSKAVILVPVAKQKAFLDLVSDTLDVKPEKGDDDVYTFNLEKLPFPLYLRFANGYAYITVRDKEVLDKDKLLAPEAVLPGAMVGTASLTVNIEEIPEDLKEKALAVIENQLAGLKDKEMPTHTEAQKKFRDAAVDELSAQVKSLFQHGGATTLRLDLDRKDGDLSLTVNVAGKPGSPLANKIRDLGQAKSLTAALLHPNSAFAVELNVSLPEKLRALLVPALQDAEKQVLAHAKDDGQREVLKTLVDGIMPTLKAAELDAAIDLRGPSEKGGYTLVGAIKIKDQAKIQNSLRKASAHFPKEIKLITSSEAEKADQIRIDRLGPDKELKNDGQRSLGGNPGYLTFRNNLLLLGAGEKGDNALKEAQKAAATPGKVIDLQVALGRMVTLFEDDPTQVAIARKVFGDGKDNDRLRLSVEGGNALTLRLSLKAKLIDYVNRVEKAKKK